MNTTKLCLGIDVSKNTLDIYWQGRSYKIKNEGASIRTFIEATIDKTEPLFCVMEPTGGYEKVAVKTFDAADIPVYLVHPNRLHAFAKAAGHFAKTDKLDAKLLHQYGLSMITEEDEAYVIDEQYECIIDLRRTARFLEKALHAAQCRLKQVLPSCQVHIEATITTYKQQLSQIQSRINDTINSDSSLKGKRDIMVTVKGVGEKTASMILTEIPEIGTLSRQAVTSLVGLAPQTYQSGKRSAVGHITGGRFYARKALYMAALVASRYDFVAKTRYQGLLNKGKPKKVALVAIMRDIVVSLNAMVRKMQPYRTPSMAT